MNKKVKRRDQRQRICDGWVVSSIFPLRVCHPSAPPHYEVLDCSNVTSERELRSIFQRDFPTNYFSKFLMDGNMYVSTLSEGTFGEKSFREVVITNGVLGRVEPKALLGSVLSLQEIDLESNYLTYFPAEEIPLYTNLESLNLRGNKLTSLANILSQTLMDVKLDGNPMGHVPVDFLQDVPELQIFSCSSCGLTEIQTGTFTRGPQLRFVDLGYNELTFLPEGAFNLAPFDSMLVLSDNKLSSASQEPLTVRLL
ncbi:oplophorus-luciferin 2-monooxygenase non-catalytic subunit-like [Macrobrachium nipponense]|uniref:oplophorus-luciferin 2-monooxygenase non-catalytic subunit-like n=1 Tax=Macrobrachium nipponense TaxID=159736 RepID=UPI0030C8C939